MAKTSMIMREKRREKLVKQHAAKRAQLKEAIRSPKSTDAEREEAQRKLNAMPRDSSASRVRNRCAITGRSRGVYRKFGLGRQKLREATMRGDIPGLGKAVKQNANTGVAAGINSLGKEAELEAKKARAFPLRFVDGAVFLGPLKVGQVPPLF